MSGCVDTMPMPAMRRSRSIAFCAKRAFWSASWRPELVLTERAWKRKNGTARPKTMTNRKSAIISSMSVTPRRMVESRCEVSVVFIRRRAMMVDFFTGLDRLGCETVTVMAV